MSRTALAFAALIWASAFQVPKPEPKEIPKPALTVSSEDLMAILAAERAFQANTFIPPEKKNLANYHLEIFPKDGAIAVLFVPLWTPQDINTRGGSTALGVEVTFYVDKKTWTVTKTLFAM